MKDFTLSDNFHPEGFQFKLLIKKITRSLGILGVFLISFGAYSQVIIEGAIPVESPKGGFAVDGDATAGTPGAYIDVVSFTHPTLPTTP